MKVLENGVQCDAAPIGCNKLGPQLSHTLCRILDLVVICSAHTKLLVAIHAVQHRKCGTSKAWCSVFWILDASILPRRMMLTDVRVKADHDRAYAWVDVQFAPRAHVDRLARVRRTTDVLNAS